MLNRAWRRSPGRPSRVRRSSSGRANSAASCSTPEARRSTCSTSRRARSRSATAPAQRRGPRSTQRESRASARASSGRCSAPPGEATVVARSPMADTRSITTRTKGRTRFSATTSWNSAGRGSPSVAAASPYPPTAELPMNDRDPLTARQVRLNEESSTDYSDLGALFINCTLKRSPERSNTQGLMEISEEIMRRNGVEVESIRAIDHDIATGVWPDMTEHGWEKDAWPEIYERVLAADILVLGMPIWLGEKSSVCTKVIERLYGNSHLLNDAGQYAYYGRVAGCLITGNEDGVKHCALETLYALQHLGYPIPPQADAGWIGEVGPGPSYWIPARVGRTTTSPTATPPS